MAPLESGKERDAPPLAAAVIELVRLLARQAAAEAVRHAATDDAKAVSQAKADTSK